jgi:NitT/TauT family transport system permease protein
LSGKTVRRPGLKLWAVAIWIGIWFAVSSLLGEEIILASPWQVILRLFELVQQADYWKRVGFSCARVMGGMLAGMALGVMLGTLAHFKKWFRGFLSPFIAFIRAIPVVSFIILALYMLTGDVLSCFITFIICFPVFYSNTVAGLAAADEKLLEMARFFKISIFKRLYAIYLPVLLGHLLSACEVAVGLAWKSGVAAEYIAIPAASIGRRLYDAKINLKSADMLAWTVTIVLLSAFFSWLIRLVLRQAVQKWGAGE